MVRALLFLLSVVYHVRAADDVDLVQATKPFWNAAMAKLGAKINGNKAANEEENGEASQLNRDVAAAPAPALAPASREEGDAERRGGGGGGAANNTTTTTTIDMSWPNCVSQVERIKSFDAEDLFADLIDYGGASGCKDNECADSDEMAEDNPAKCALICQTLTNCRFWTWGPEGSTNKCWFRSGNTKKTTLPAEAEGYVTGSRDCVPPADFSADIAHPPSAEIVTFEGPNCATGAASLNGKDFLRLGTSGNMSFYYNKLLGKWLYYDPDCNGWVVRTRAPGTPAEHDGCSAAWAMSPGEAGSFGGPVSSRWLVDCNSEGNASDQHSLPMKVEKSGLKAEFWKADDNGNNTARVEADVARVDSRVDYWLTTQAWDGLDQNMTSNFFALWQGYLKVTTPGDYSFTLGSSDNSALKWFHPSSQTYATFEHIVPSEFAYSSTTDMSPETFRSLETGYHKFRLEFAQRNQAGAGFVFKYKGADTNGVWQVVPSSALSVEPPTCAVPDHIECAEGSFIPGGENCTVQCDTGGFSTPLAIQCVVTGLTTALEGFVCSVPTPSPTPPPTEYWPDMDGVPSIVPDAR